RQAAQLCQNARGPVVQFVQVTSLDGVLELRIAEPTADIQILSRSKEERGSGNLRQLGAQPVDHLLHAGGMMPDSVALIERLESDKHSRRVGNAGPSGKSHCRLHRRVLPT